MDPIEDLINPDDSDDSNNGGRSPDFTWNGVSAWVNKSHAGNYYLNINIPILGNTFPLFPESEAAQKALRYIYQRAIK